MSVTSIVNRHHDRVTVIANPAAGSTGADFVSAVTKEIGKYAEKVDLLWTGGQGHAAELARRYAAGSTGETPPDVIVVIGGDGTLREVADGAVGAPAAIAPPILLLPGGTGNSNYRSLWDDMPWRHALAAGLTEAGAERRHLDLAEITDLPRLVVLGVSTGLFADATAAASGLPVAGRARYQAAITETARTYTPYPGQVAVDGAIIHEGPTVLVNIGGSRHRAGVLEVLPRSLRDDGLLDVCVIGSPVTAPEVFDLLRSGDHLGRDGVAYARGKSVTVRCLDGSMLRFESDGEVVKRDLPEITVRVLARALPVLSSTLRPGG